MDDAALWQAFTGRSLQNTEWTHRAHLRVAWMHLARWPDLDEAHLRMRIGIVRLNTAHGLEETPARGYHETLTRFWLALLAKLRANDHSTDSSDSVAFLERHPALLDKLTPLRHYSRDRLFSLEARAIYVPPDLEPL